MDVVTCTAHPSLGDKSASGPVHTVALVMAEKDIPHRNRRCQLASLPLQAGGFPCKALSPFLSHMLGRDQSDLVQEGGYTDLQGKMGTPSRCMMNLALSLIWNSATFPFARLSARG